MNTNELMKLLINKKGLSMRGASLAMGRSPNWLASTTGKPGSSEAATVAELAEVCGYKLAAIPADDVPDTALVIDPPNKEKE